MYKTESKHLTANLEVKHKRSLARIVLTLLPVAIIIALVVPSCNDQQPRTSSLVLPDSNISYSRDIDPLFAQTCLDSQCHSGSAPAQGLDLVPPSYSKLIFYNPPLVQPRDTNSLLLQFLDGRMYPQMPSSQAPLTQNQIHGIKEWILEGAKNN